MLDIRVIMEAGVVDVSVILGYCKLSFGGKGSSGRFIMEEVTPASIKRERIWWSTS